MNMPGPQMDMPGPQMDMPGPQMTQMTQMRRQVGVGARWRIGLDPQSGRVRMHLRHLWLNISARCASSHRSSPRV
jgi:hypothetical protein